MIYALNIIDFTIQAHQKKVLVGCCHSDPFKGDKEWGIIYNLRSCAEFVAVVEGYFVSYKILGSPQL